MHNKNCVLALALLGICSLSTPALASEKLAEKHNCLGCHEINEKVVGPAFKDVAARYQNDAEAQAKLMTKVRKGGKGVWGTLSMPAHPGVPEEDLAHLVNWVLSLSQ